MNGNAFITNEVVRLPVNGVLKAKELNALKRNQFMICSLKNSSVQSKTVFALPIKEMHFEQPNIQTQWKGDTLSLSTDFPAFQVYLHGIDGHFSDNFFTLLPNEKKEVVFEGEAHLYQLRIFSLANLFDK